MLWSGDLDVQDTSVTQCCLQAPLLFSAPCCHGLSCAQARLPEHDWPREGPVNHNRRTCQLLRTLLTQLQRSLVPEHAPSMLLLPALLPFPLELCPLLCCLLLASSWGIQTTLQDYGLGQGFCCCCTCIWIAAVCLNRSTPEETVQQQHGDTEKLQSHRRCPLLLRV